jgi:hypothetical protein
MEDIMDTKLVKFEEVNIGWDIIFEVTLPSKEVSGCSIEPLEDVASYEIVLNGNIMSFSGILNRNELYENETIEARLEAIRNEVDNLSEACLKTSSEITL